MLPSQLLLLSLLPLIHAQETLLGAYIFHRHGDRTSKSYPPTILTDLGYTQVYASGNYYRNRYINGSSPMVKIATDIVKNSQLSVEAPVDPVLQTSAQGWLQGLYPPVGAALGIQTLADGTKVQAPLDGYQLIPINAVASAASGANSENSAWLQGSSGCLNAITSSNNYFISQDFLDLSNSTKEFYQGLLPVINGTFTAATDIYKNAYSIFDFVHVSVIHNASSAIPSDDLLTAPSLFQLQTLADHHEFNLAYNASEKIRAIAGSTLAAQIVQSLNNTLDTNSSQPLSVQFGAYGSFLSFFGLSQLPDASVNFTGIVDYASSMAFELVTNASYSNTSYPSTADISVRFLFSNGSAALTGGLQPYPLFGGQNATISWSDFVTGMANISIGDQATWCSACGNSTGVCANQTSSSSSGSASATAAASTGSGGISKAVAGVIGATVTLAVILGIEALVLVAAGLRIVSKKRMARRTVDAGSPTGVKA